MAELRKPLESLGDFIGRLEKAKALSGRTDFFRGHADATYLLRPSLFRNKSQRKDEKNIFRELVSLHPSEFNADRTVFEQLVRMQHFSLPTRLLDITYNPLVALFFACRGSPSKEGQLLRFSVKSSSIRYYDSDTVSCLANLSNLTGRERDSLRNLASSSELNRDSGEGKRLIQFIKAEKPYFLPEIELSDLNSVVTVRPKYNNRRILAQQGAFFLFGLPSEIEKDNQFDIRTYRTPIPPSVKSQIVRDLDKLNINESSLFPEVESAAKYIMSKLVPVAQHAPED